MDVEANYVDSHGQSEIGFGITRLLGFDLLPRIKRINKVKLYRPIGRQPDAYPQLTPALTRPIRWDLIAQQYDQMIKYATAIRTRHRVDRGDPAPLHPQRLPPHLPGDAGGRPRAEDHLRRPLPARRDLQREIEEGLNVIESSNGANSVIATARAGRSPPTGATSRRCPCCACASCNPPWST